jgi:hypothetical protein
MFRLWALNGPTGCHITGCQIMRKWGRTKRKVNGSTLRVRISFINNNYAIPLTKYNSELIWVSELRGSKLTVADFSVRAVYSALLLGMRVLCVVRYRSLQRADHSFRGVPPSFVCPSVIEKPHGGGLGPLWLSNHKKKWPGGLPCARCIQTLNSAPNSVSDKAKCRLTAGRVFRILFYYLMW